MTQRGPGDQEDQAHPGLGQTKCGQMEQGTAEVTPQILCSVSGSHNQKDSEVLEWVQRTGTELGRVWSTGWTKRGWGSCGCSACRKGSSRETSLLFERSQVGVSLSPQTASDRMRRNGLKLCCDELDWIWEKISSLKESSTGAQASQPLETSPPKMFKRHVDTALTDHV